MPTINKPIELMEIINGFRLSRVILTAYELELFTAIGNEWNTSKEISSKIKTDERATDRLMNVLVGCGLLEKKNGKFKNSEFSQRFLVKSSPRYLGGIGHMAHLWHSWTTMTDAVRKGTTVMMRDPLNDRSTDWIAPFIAAMHQRGKQQAKEIASLLDLKSVNKMLDVGGGSGAFSFAMVDKKPSLKAIVYDLPNVLPETKKYIDKEGYSGKVETLAGNYLNDPLGNGYEHPWACSRPNGRSCNRAWMPSRESSPAAVPARILAQRLRANS